uniref:hypothetical protein n=1 Tax=Streptomyces griseus TaxID=1911 RepID=UPI001ABF6310
VVGAFGLAGGPVRRGVVRVRVGRIAVRHGQAESSHDHAAGEPGAFAPESFLPGRAVPEPRKDTTFKE